MADIAERLVSLRSLQVNFDREAARREEDGWRVDDYRQALPAEAPGPPQEGGSFKVAQELLRSYQVADPRLVRAHYDDDAPLEGRNMLLELRFLVFRVFVGCRVGEVTDEQRTVDGRPVQVWGWPYRTLEGHIEQGEMAWEVWKWLDTGEVEFRISSYSRFVGNGNPFTTVGVGIVGQRARSRYLGTACRRMAELTREGLRGSYPASGG